MLQRVSRGKLTGGGTTHAAPTVHSLFQTYCLITGWNLMFVVENDAECQEIYQSNSKQKERLLKGPSRVATEKSVNFWNTYNFA